MKKFFWSKESDRYFERAKQAKDGNLFPATYKDPFIEQLLELAQTHQISAHSLLDIGCSYGANIDACKRLGSFQKIVGVDLGSHALEYAKKHLEDEKTCFINSSCHDLSILKDTFDIVILSMVLQWVPRDLLFATLSQVDKIIKPSGVIYLAEFSTDEPYRRISKHNHDIAIFKDDYERLFTTFPWYKSLHTAIQNPQDPSNEQCRVSLIQKIDFNNAYPLKAIHDD